MPSSEDQPTTDRNSLERLAQPLILLIFLDMVTFGIYTAARTYILHTELSQKIGRRLFSIGFLHILIVLNIALFVLRFSRDSQPLNMTLIIVHLGSGLLFSSLLLIFRRSLHELFDIHMRPLALGIFGFWYLQYYINRAPQHRLRHHPYRESWTTAPLVMILYGTLSLTLGSLKHFRIANPCMEPTLVVGDYVLLDKVSYKLLAKPQRSEIVMFQSPQDKSSVNVQRVLGLPGDRLGFYGDSIFLNGERLPCDEIRPAKPSFAAFDQTPKKTFHCRLADHSFIHHRYQEGALTAVEGEFVVPVDHYFLIGDNMDNSPDSRTLGAIPKDKVVGRVWLTTASYRLGESIPWQRWLHFL